MPNFENIITGFDLKSRDHITVRKTPGWSPEMKVVISGEVLYPGEYLITKDDERESDMRDLFLKFVDQWQKVKRTQK